MLPYATVGGAVSKKKAAADVNPEDMLLGEEDDAAEDDDKDDDDIAADSMIKVYNKKLFFFTAFVSFLIFLITLFRAGQKADKGQGFLLLCFDDVQGKRRRKGLSRGQEKVMNGKRNKRFFRTTTCLSDTKSRFPL